jgi:hypothetical protein
MGGRGSGRLFRWGTATTLEEVKRIDIRYLRRQGMLVAGCRSTMSWSRGDEPTGSIGLRAEDDRLVLNYRVREHDDDWTSVTQAIWLERTPCHFGGERAWLLCPRCGRRVAVLCGLSTYFWCRHCYQLPYGSQRESYSDRMMRKARKIRARLDADNNLMEPIYEKPKGMHWQTFERLCEEEDAANSASLMAMATRLGLFY